MQRIESDLCELAAYFLTSKDGQAPERLVLFIDDLDRCPPNQVVAILEAIQLLLADNPSLPPGTPNPFVVVLGVDTQILTRALEREYECILSSMERPSGLDYIEKVIQIPYWIPQIDRNVYRQYLYGLTGLATAQVKRLRSAGREGQASHSHGSGVSDTQEVAGVRPGDPAAAPAGSSDVEEAATSGASDDGSEDFVVHLHEMELITQEEMDFFVECEPIGPRNPRALKRLVNQYKLCKSIALATSRTRFKPGITIFLLCLADGFRASTRILVRLLEHERQHIDYRREETNLVDVFRRLRNQSSELRPSLRAEFAVLSRVLEAFRKLRERGLDLSIRALAEAAKGVIPFCFIGDVVQKAGQDVSNVDIESLLPRGLDDDPE